jgi:hypothetical protein
VVVDPLDVAADLVCNECFSADFDDVVVVGGDEEVLWWWVLVADW